MNLQDTVKKWQENWFYLPDERTLSGHQGLPSYDPAPADYHIGWNPKLTRAEKVDVNLLMKKIGELQAKGLTRTDLAATWVSGRIQPLQAPWTPMWWYSGLDDPTRSWRIPSSS